MLGCSQPEAQLEASLGVGSLSESQEALHPRLSATVSLSRMVLSVSPGHLLGDGLQTVQEVSPVCTLPQGSSD